MSHCRQDQKLVTNTVQTPTFLTTHFNDYCRELIAFEASFLVTNLAEMGQKVREGGRMGCVSLAAVKVIRSPHSTLQIPLRLWLIFTDEGREAQGRALGTGEKMRTDLWLQGCSSGARSPSHATQLPLMVCSFSTVWPSAKFVWQHQRKKKRSKDIRARLIYISLNILPLPRKKELRPKS